LTLTEDTVVEVAAEDPKPRPPRRMGFILGATAIGGALATGWLLLGSPWLSVHTIEVSGYPDTDEIVAASGISQGSPLLLLNPAAVSEQVSGLDTVAATTVERQWPDGVVITVIPESAVAYITSPDGVSILGSNGGQLSVQGEPPVDLPLIGPMTEIQGADALLLLGSLPADTRSLVESVQFSDDNGYSLVMRDGRGVVVWGQSQEAQLKSTVLAAMMRVDDTARWFDVTNPREPRAATQAPPTADGSMTPVDPLADPAPGENEVPQSVLPPPSEPGMGGEQGVGLRPAQ
jgi:cell division protein FtsQ